MKGGAVEKCVRGRCGSCHDLPFNAAQHAAIRTNENQYKLKSEESVKVHAVQKCRLLNMEDTLFFNFSGFKT